MRALFIDGQRSGYVPEQCEKTMTINELIERLEEIREWYNAGDLPVYLYNDNGYTYGEINEYTMNIGNYEDDGDGVVFEEEWMMLTYKFSDSKGNIYYGEFKSRNAACEYAYKAGLCFEGRI